MSAEGSIGIDVRLIGDDAVVASVEPGSPGTDAGLRPGYVIQSLDGDTIEQLAEETLQIPPLHERNRRKRITDSVLTHIFGSPGTTVSVDYLDEHGGAHTVSINRANRPGKVVLGESLPPFYIDFDFQRLDGDIGYIRFNAFLPPVDQRFVQAIDSMGDVAGLIIDVRGNHGGLFPVRKALAEKLLIERTLFWRYERRDDTRDVYLNPSTQAYKGPVVVLIDVLSVSSAEEFSSGLQAIGRAAVVGDRSLGIVVVGEITQLQNAATFFYPVEQSKTSSGTILKGRGVIPDIEVALDREKLLQGVDSQLQAAIEYLEKEAQPAALGKEVLPYNIPGECAAASCSTYGGIRVRSTCPRSVSRASAENLPGATRELDIASRALHRQGAGWSARTRVPVGNS